MSRLHLGINTCFAVKRWPEPEQWVRIVKDELGLDCCQFSLDLVDPLLDEAATGAYADTVRQLATQYDLSIHSTFTGLAAYSWSQLLHPQQAMREAAMRWYERAIDFTARLGASGTGGHIGAFSVQDAMNPERKERLLKELRGRLIVLSNRAAHRGLSHLFFENMAVEREWGHSIEEAQELTNMGVGTHVPLVLCLDVGHPCALHTGTASDDYLAWFAQPWPHQPIVHLQQTDRSGDHHWPFTRSYNAQGMVRAEAVLQAIEPWLAHGDVYLFLEPIHPFEADDNTVLDELKESVAYWREALSTS
ncbi:MAG TPA: TIM barrel protein [Ktedonobacteraceae bacterium]|nr:TIM barrel protein [Ktedonobacteraceae bacterium]